MRRENSDAGSRGVRRLTSWRRQTLDLVEEGGHGGGRAGGRL